VVVAKILKEGSPEEAEMEDDQEDEEEEMPRK
jgi:hypothetical protein